MASDFAANWSRRMGQIASTVESRIYLLAGLWALIFGAIACVSILVSHNGQGGMAQGRDFLFYGFLALAPFLAVRLADLSFPRNVYRGPERRSRPRRGRWLHLDERAARSHPDFGTTGLLAALALGLLANIGFRCGEFLIAMPPAALEGPHWARVLFSAMMLDAILFSLLYAFAFVMAVRHAPAFPRLLAIIWALDLASQLLIAQALATTQVPPQVVPALTTVLIGNLKKTLISVTIWLPYLLVSSRVNVTYRRRILCATPV